MEKVSDGERRSRRGEREGFRERVLERENGGFEEEEAGGNSRQR